MGVRERVTETLSVCVRRSCIEKREKPVYEWTGISESDSIVRLLRLKGAKGLSGCGILVTA